MCKDFIFKNFTDPTKRGLTQTPLMHLYMSINLHACVTQAMCIRMHATFIHCSQHMSATPTSCQGYHISTTVTLSRCQVIERIISYILYRRNGKDLS